MRLSQSMDAIVKSTSIFGVLYYEPDYDCEQVHTLYPCHWLGFTISC